MPYRILLLTFGLLPLVLGSPLWAADVTCTLLYDDHPLDVLFDDITSSNVFVSPWDGGDNIDGTFDPETSTVIFEGLDAGQWGLSVYLDRSHPSNGTGDAGDLWAYANIVVTDPGESITMDLDVLYLYHVISPIDSDSPLDGAGRDCTAHPAVPYPVTFAIDPVPQATEYEATLFQFQCPQNILDAQTWPMLEEPTVNIEWGTVGEDFQELNFTCTGTSGKPLCSAPTFHYSDVGVWALLLRDDQDDGRGRHHNNAIVIPAVAGIAGAQGTYWTSAVTVVNPGYWDQTITMTYTPRNSDGSVTFTQAEVLLPARSQVSWQNVLTEVFSTTGAGALEIRGQQQLVVNSRTSTPAEGDGTYGQGIPPIQPDQVLSIGGTPSATMGGVVEGSAFRTNLGLSEFWGDPATVRVTIFDGTMLQLGFRDIELRPFENTQVNQVADEIGHTSNLAGGIVTVEVLSGEGRVGAYLSVVDNETGDPTYVAIAPQAPAGG